MTIGLEWNVSTVGKPIPAPYTTQVTQGTVLVDILNKAADEAADSPFNKYQCTYTAGLGRAITAMNGVPQVCICSCSFACRPQRRFGQIRQIPHAQN